MIDLRRQQVVEHVHGGGGCGQVVEPGLAADSTEKLESMNVTSGEGLECLAVRKLQIHFSTVGFDQAEAVELARGAVVNQGAEVAPIDVAAFAGRRLDTNVSAACDRVLPHRPQIVLDDRKSALEAEARQVLRD